MKKTLFPLLALIALASCSKSEIVIDDDTQPVPIQLTSGIGTVNTRAVVTDKATVRLEFWEGTAEPTDYTKIAAATWNSTADVTTTSATLSLKKLVYYNADDAIKSYIKGWYPDVASASGKVRFTNTDGTVDVLLCNTISGSKKTVVSTPLVFDHQSTQLIFKVQGDETLLAGTKISEIKVTGSSVPTGITLNSGTTKDEVTYTAKTELAVPSITVTEIPSGASPTAIVAGEPLMIKPVANNTTLKLDIKTVKSDGTTPAATYTDVAFTTDESQLKKGVAYTITLTFKQNGVLPTASITPWVEKTGQGDVI